MNKYNLRCTRKNFSGGKVEVLSKLASSKKKKVDSPQRKEESSEHNSDKSLKCSPVEKLRHRKHRQRIKVCTKKCSVSIERFHSKDNSKFVTDGESNVGTSQSGVSNLRCWLNSSVVGNTKNLQIAPSVDLTPAPLRCRSPCRSGSDTSTPVSQNNEVLQPASTKENMFGFQQILQASTKPSATIPRLDLGSPITDSSTSRSRHHLKARSKSSKDVEHKRHHAWDNCLSSTSPVYISKPQRVSKYSNLERKLKKNKLPQLCDDEINSELFHLESESNSSGDECDSDTNIAFSPKKITKSKKPALNAINNKPHKKTHRPPAKPLIMPDIPWKEIMEHELVIE